MLKKAALILTFTLAFNFFFIPGTAADELLNVQKKLDEKKAQQSQIQKELDQIKSQLGFISSSLYATEPELNEANAKVKEIKKKLNKVEKEVELKEKELEQLVSVRDEQIRLLYKHPQAGFMELLLGSDSVASLGESFVYQTSIVDKSHQLITVVNEELTEIESERDQISAIKKNLEATANEIASRVAALRVQKQSAESSSRYLSNQLISINITLKGLTAKQQQLLASKFGTSAVSTGGLPLADDPNARPSFNPGFSPAFAAFSFGAYTHRNGMSQYGALGRAKRGQTAQQILVAYYPGTTLNKKYPTPATITVNGTNEFGQAFYNEVYNFETYIKHIYEVPTSWPMEVLKAQAVAARSYAIKRGSPICPSQACQVMKKEINSSAWQQAVDATRGWVLTGGSGSFQYSSTAGGYLNTSGWDTTSRTRSTWPAGSYESIAGSPWFYKGWYVDLAYVRGDFRRTCGRTHPWLTQKEFTDLLNAWVVYTKGTSTEKSRVSPVDTACWGGDPYSISEMKSRANQLGGSYNNVYAVAVSYSNGGFTSSVALSTDRGSFAIDGPTFKDIFNLRAPARISIRSPLFNIEKK